MCDVCTSEYYQGCHYELACQWHLEAFWREVLLLMI